MGKRATVEDFWARVEKTDGCWYWRGAVDHKGYGRLKYGGRKWLAPRLAWYFAHGARPDGCVLHRCDNPLCVRMEHLFTGTRADNNADRVAKGRSAKGDAHWSRARPANLRRGEAHGRAKLTVADVLEARLLHAEGWSYPVLGRRYGVTHRTIMDAVIAKTWSHVT